MSAMKQYGTVSAERQKEMTGLEFVQGLADGTLPHNTMAGTLGYDDRRGREGAGRRYRRAEAPAISIRPAPCMAGWRRRCSTAAWGWRSRPCWTRASGSTTLEFKISFVRPITPETGPIRAEGTVINQGRRVGTAEGRVTDGKGRLLVHGTTTCLIFDR